MRSSAQANEAGKLLRHFQQLLHNCKHKLSFEVVEKRQHPLLSGETREHLGFTGFTILDEVLKIEHSQTSPLTKVMLIKKCSHVLTAPIESVPGEVHFDLVSNVPAVQCAPRYVPSC